jgi:hypothetical protein
MRQLEKIQDLCLQLGRSRFNDSWEGLTYGYIKPPCSTTTNSQESNCEDKPKKVTIQSRKEGASFFGRSTTCLDLLSSSLNTSSIGRTEKKVEKYLFLISVLVNRSDMFVICYLPPTVSLTLSLSLVMAMG